MKAFVASVVCAWLCAGAATASPLPVYRPADAWVRPVVVPEGKVDRDGAASQVLLQNVQTRFGAERDDFYNETAVKIRPPGNDDIAPFL